MTTPIRPIVALLSILWLIYSVILAVAPDGRGLISNVASVLSIAVLDVAAKMVYGFMAVPADTTAIDRDLAEGIGHASLRMAA